MPRNQFLDRSFQIRLIKGKSEAKAKHVMKNRGPRIVLAVKDHAMLELRQRISILDLERHAGLVCFGNERERLDGKIDGILDIVAEMTRQGGDGRLLEEFLQ